MFLEKVKVTCFVILSFSILKASAEFYGDGSQFLLKEFDELKHRVTDGFIEQWKLIQKLRYQGLKQHKGIINIYNEVQKLTKEIRKLKCRKCCFKEGKGIVKAGTSNCTSEEINGRCYYFGNKEMSWDGANKYCKSIGGYLFDGRDEAVFNELRNHLKTTNTKAYQRSYRLLWVGGQYFDDGHWRWSREKQMKSTNKVQEEEEDSVVIDSKSWAAYEPMVGLKGTLCMALDGSQDYRGVTKLCRHYWNFVCSL